MKNEKKKKKGGLKIDDPTRFFEASLLDLVRCNNVNGSQWYHSR